MKRLLLPLIAALVLPVQAGVDPEVRKACLKAVDFEGCVRAYSSPKSQNIDQPQFDVLGKPIIKGWIKHEEATKNSVWYIRPDVKSVQADGRFDRYIIRDVIQRWYVGPRAGIASRTFNLGTYNTSCSSYYGSTTCSTTPPQTITIPGRSSFAGGVLQHSFSVVIDCNDRKSRYYGDPKYLPWGSRKWKSIDKNIIAANTYREGCYKIDSLQRSGFTRLTKVSSSSNGITSPMDMD